MIEKFKIRFSPVLTLVEVRKSSLNYEQLLSKLWKFIDSLAVCWLNSKAKLIFRFK